MIGTFIALLLIAKIPSGLCLMVAAVVGAIASCIGSGTTFELRYFTEGALGYFDTILVITTAMIFMGAMQASGALEYISVLLIKAFRKYPTILLIAFMIIIMFPAMVTGSSLASAVTSGALLAPIMIKWGIPKAKAGAIVALGSILGMVAPPVNIPAMVICDAVDIAYTNFTLPLLILSIPVAIICVLLIGRKYVKPLSEDEVEFVADTTIMKELNWTVCLPLIILVLLIVGEIFLPLIFGSLGMSAMFVIATVICFFLGRKLPFWKKHGENYDPNKPDSIIEVLRHSVGRALPAMGLLMGVGMFMEIITLNGVRGFFVVNAITLPTTWRYIAMIILMPVIGGVSSFGSVSILGGPFVMALYTSYDSIMLTCGLSLMAATGEFLPPTAMSATFASQMVGEKHWTKITKAALPAVGVLLGYSILYTLLFGRLVFKDISDSITPLYLILLGVTMAVAIIFAIAWSILSKKLKCLNKSAYQVGTSVEGIEVK